MSSFRNISSCSVFAQVLGIVVLILALVSPATAKKSLPEVSSDGLHLLKHTKVRAAYAKPGASLDQYSKIKILDCFVQFKKNWQRDYNLDEVGLEGRVTDKDMAQIKQRLASEFARVFTEVLTRGGHQVVDTTGADVLLLRPALINLDVTAPDTMRAGMGNTYVASAGQMTLYLELYDSATSTLLARIIDPEAGQNGGIAMAGNGVSNMAEADQILTRWAKLLEKHLLDVKGNTSGS
jgi:hypothetical protein